MKILVIDGNSILNRAFYGIRLLTTRDGTPTNALYGFLGTYLKACEEEQPEGVCVCFDLKGPTFRHLEFADYKAGRRPMPDELAAQLPLIRELLDAMGIARFELPGYEADDLIGTIAKKCADAACECVILTGDRDSYQLVGPRTRVRLAGTKGGQPVITDVTEDVIRETYGVTPAQMIEVKALMGDASDNIPGVRGIGEKTALSLIAGFGSVAALYTEDGALRELPGVRPAVLEKLRTGYEDAAASRRLAEIDCDAPLSFDARALTVNPPDEGALVALLMRLELRSMVQRLGLHPSPKPRAAQPPQAPAALPLLWVDTDAALDSMLDAIKHASHAAFLSADDGGILSVLVSGTSYVTLRRLHTPERYTSLWAALADARLSKTTHDAKSVMHMLYTQGLPFGGFAFDTAIAGYLLEPGASNYTLPALAAQYLDLPLPEPLFEQEGAFSPLTGHKEAAEAMTAYLRAIQGLRPVLETRLQDLGMDKLYREVELPLCEVLAYMQWVGFRVDTHRLHAYGEELGSRITTLETAIYQEAGETFNINSPKQLGEILFERMGLPSGRKTKSKSGYSTDIEVLERLRPLHPIAALVIDYRQLAKLKSTYVDGLLRVISPTDGRIHSSFNQLVTTTGRISSTEPNLQNIPVRRALGAELRRMFVPENEDFVLVDADYSQIELRVLAHIADDEGLKAAFAHGQDVHRSTAAAVAGVAPEDVTAEMRSHAKAVNFGLVYGMSDFSLAQNIGVTRAAAKEYIDRYFERYPGVRRYMDAIKAQAHEMGFVTTLMGRRRWLPELKSTNHNRRAFGERVALNTPIQGTAADIIKIAMISVFRRLQREGGGARLILQVHDELIVEAPRADAARIASLVEEEMAAAMALSVPLVAEASVGEDWFDAKK